MKRAARGVFGGAVSQGGEDAPLAGVALFGQEEEAQQAAGEVRRLYRRHCVVYPCWVNAGGYSALFWALVTTPDPDADD